MSDNDNSALVDAIQELRAEVRELREQASGEQITPQERLRLAYEPADVPEDDAA
jgi:hypothetical protein